MTPQQIGLVQQTFEQVAPQAEEVAALFYARLFEIDPSTQPLFTGDMKEQGRKLMQMIGIVVRGLGRLEQLVPAIQDLGRRHVGYGVTDTHYDTVGAALLWTLEQGLKDNFSPEVKDAWATAYGMLADSMKSAAEAQAA
jgi:hemoglobin-like flavoprotein